MKFLKLLFLFSSSQNIVLNSIINKCEESSAQTTSSLTCRQCRGDYFLVENDCLKCPDTGRIKLLCGELRIPEEPTQKQIEQGKKYCKLFENNVCITCNDGYKKDKKYICIKKNAQQVKKERCRIQRKNLNMCLSCVIDINMLVCDTSTSDQQDVQQQDQYKEEEPIILAGVRRNSLTRVSPKVGTPWNIQKFFDQVYKDKKN